jgi:hypothetical protein
VSDDVVVYELDDTKVTVPLPEQLWHVPVRIDSESQMPGDWQGSVAEWVLAQVRAHADTIALTAEQFETLMPADGAAAPSSTAAPHETVVLAAAFEGPEAAEHILLPAHGSGDLHGLVMAYIA